MKLNDYKTKKAKEDYVREVLYKKISECDDVKAKSKEDYDKLIEVLERHPDFKTKTNGMIKIAIRRNKLNKKALEIIIVKKNTEEDISWKTCITGKNKSPEEELLSALRSSISVQTRTFRNQSELICAFCDEPDNIHVDHYDPDFQDLVIDFHEKHKHITIPYEFEDDPDTHCRKFHDVDNSYEEQWQKYHKDNANLRILCAKCNYSRPKTRNKFKLT